MLCSYNPYYLLSSALPGINLIEGGVHARGSLMVILGFPMEKEIRQTQNVM
jgi:hypothetical protein